MLNICTFYNYAYICYIKLNKQIMATQEIKVGLKFKLTETGRTYEVVRLSDVSVWYKDLTREPIWRVAKTTFLTKFSNGFEVCKEVDLENKSIKY